MFTFVGGAIGLLVVLSIGTPEKYTSDYVLDILTMGVGLATYLRAAYVPRAIVNVVVALSTIIVSLQIATGSGKDPSSLAVVFYVWIALFCFSFLSTYESLAHIVFVILAYTLAIIFGEKPSAPIADWILTTSTVIVASISSGFLNYTIRKLAVTDALTGISNRKGWDLAVSREIARARRTNNFVVVGIIDLDQFKHLNDTHGHHFGDEILKSAANTIKASLRTFDVVARWGGDEFVFLALITDDIHAHALLMRLSESLHGVAKHRCGAVLSRPILDTIRLVSHADRVLYEAKANPELSYVLDTSAT